MRRHPTVTTIPIVPFSPSPVWFKQMTEMLIGYLSQLPAKRNLLKNSEKGELYPSTETFRLTTWLLPVDCLVSAS